MTAEQRPDDLAAAVDCLASELLRSYYSWRLRKGLARAWRKECGETRLKTKFGGCECDATLQAAANHLNVEVRPAGEQEPQERWRLPRSEANAHEHELLKERAVEAKRAADDADERAVKDTAAPSPYAELHDLKQIAKLPDKVVIAEAERRIAERDAFQAEWMRSGGGIAYDSGRRWPHIAVWAEEANRRIRAQNARERERNPRTTGKLLTRVMRDVNHPSGGLGIRRELRWEYR